MRLVSRSGLIATALAIGAIAAPSAQAGLLSGTTPDPPGAAQQEAQSFHRIYSHQASTPFVATPDQATIARDQAGDAQLSAAFERQAQIYGRNITSTPTSVASVRSDPGFQFGDAAIGASVTAVLVVLAIGSTLIVRRRRELRHG